MATLLSACCRPLYTMLLRWLLDGTLEDPYNEFFIHGEASVQGEDIWHRKYSIRVAMIPKFLSLSWAKKILSTGKSINFLHSVCGDTGHVEGRAGAVSRLERMDPATLFRGEVDNPLLETVGQLYGVTARHVLDIMYGKFQLMAHLAALRKYMLLGQGDIMATCWTCSTRSCASPRSSSTPTTWPASWRPPSAAPTRSSRITCSASTTRCPVPSGWCSHPT